MLCYGWFVLADREGHGPMAPSLKRHYFKCSKNRKFMHMNDIRTYDTVYKNYGPCIVIVL